MSDKYLADINREEFIANIYLGKYGSFYEDFQVYYYTTIEGLFVRKDKNTGEINYSNPNDIAHNATRFYLKEEI